MTVEKATRRRDRIAKIAALFFFLFVGSAFDGLIALYRQPLNSSYVMPGESVRINGPVSPKAKGLEDLGYTSDSDSLRIVFEEIYSGFWMGGRMWRGTLTVSPEAVAGEYHAVVNSGEEPPPKPDAIYTVFVYRGEDELRALSTSLIRRHLGWSPWWSAASCLTLMCVLVGFVYLFSQKRETLLAEAGMADIYRIERLAGRSEVAFALGTRHGIGIGARLALLDGSGQIRGRVEVKRISETDAIAEVDADTEVEPGYMVRKTSL